MYKYYRSFIITLITLIVFCNGGKSDVEYYRRLEANEFIYNGRYAIEENQATNINCYKFLYDHEGRIIEIQYLKGSAPENSPIYGYSKVVFEYLDSIENRYFYNSEGMPYRDDINRHVYEHKGDTIYSYTIDTNDQITEDSLGVSKYIYTMANENRIINIKRFDREGKQIFDKNNNYETRLDYDRDGNIKETANYFNDELTNDINGVSTMSYRYDSLGNIIAKEFFNASSRPAMNQEYGASKIEIDYDELGYPVEIRSYDDHAALTFNKQYNSAIAKFAYDDAGNVGEILLYDNKDKLRQKMKLSGSWQLAEKDIYENDIKADSSSGEIAATLFKYNDNNEIIEKAFLDNDKDLVDNDSGYALIQYKYDNHGHIIESAYYDQDRFLVEPAAIGYAIKRTDYQKDKIIKVSFLNSHNELTINPWLGIAYTASKYDNRDSLIEVATYDTNGRLREENDEEIAIIRKKYNEQGQVVEKAYYGADGRLKFPKSKPCAIERYKFDKSGRMIEMSMYDVDGKLMNYRDTGIALIKYEYDENGNQVCSYAYDKDMILVGVK